MYERLRDSSCIEALILEDIKKIMDNIGAVSIRTEHQDLQMDLKHYCYHLTLDLVTEIKSPSSLKRILLMTNLPLFIIQIRVDVLLWHVF
jgi:hypothetical protein